MKKDDGTQASRQFQANILLNTQGDKINAIEGKIIFPSDKLELKEIKEELNVKVPEDEKSVSNLWIVGAAVVVVLVLGLFILRRRKKK